LIPSLINYFKNQLYVFGKSINTFFSVYFKVLKHCKKCIVLTQTEGLLAGLSHPECEILTAVSMKMAVFWVVVPSDAQKFTDVSEVLSASIIRATIIAGKLLSDCTAQQPRRQPSSLITCVWTCDGMFGRLHKRDIIYTLYQIMLA
jgi:hypothetical protein